MDLSYATILSPDGTMVRLNRELERKYHVEDPKNPHNELKHRLDEIGDYVILFNFLEPLEEKDKEEKLSEVWHMNFDGAYSRSNKNPERVEAIEKIHLPPTKKVLQSFFGKINFVRRLIPNFAKVAKPISKILKKDIRFQWDEQG